MCGLLIVEFLIKVCNIWIHLNWLCWWLYWIVNKKMVRIRQFHTRGQNIAKYLSCNLCHNLLIDATKVTQCFHTCKNFYWSIDPFNIFCNFVHFWLYVYTLVNIILYYINNRFNLYRTVKKYLTFNNLIIF
jgi:hypothetical protein